MITDDAKEKVTHIEHRLSGERRLLPAEAQVAFDDVGTKWVLEDNHDPREAVLMGRLGGCTTTIRIVEN
eukprot:8113775-Prorocentrum_lima.AAC.1